MKSPKITFIKLPAKVVSFGKGAGMFFQFLVEQGHLQRWLDYLLLAMWLFLTVYTYVQRDWVMLFFALLFTVKSTYDVVKRAVMDELGHYQMMIKISKDLDKIDELIKSEIKQYEDLERDAKTLKGKMRQTTH